MKPFVITSLALVLSAPVLAAEERVIELKDGSTVYINAKGEMTMRDSAGHKLFMKEGEPMEAKDGSIFMMKENVIWKKWRQKGTLNPKVDG